MGIYAYFCIYRSATFGVVILKASMLDRGGQSAMGICALFYIYVTAPHWGLHRYTR